jgi:indole-3-glycerol phosphate synthase
MSTNILDRIVAEKLREVERLPLETVTAETLREASRTLPPRRGFVAALRGASRPPALIAEVKKASPSAGVIRADFDPVGIAKEYEAGGASCLSVLTDERFFQGSLQYLSSIREAVSLPLLRKDFILDPRQVLEALRAGADAILLIVAILTDEALKNLLACAEAAGLDTLVEVHDEEELDRALAAGARLVGVNNRNLKTFTVDLAVTERLAGRLWRARGRDEALLVAESGIHTRADVVRLQACGAGAILVGESLMREREIGAKVRELLG